MKEKSHKEDDIKVDTGAGANVLPLLNYKTLYTKLVLKNGKPDAVYRRKCQRKLEAYGGVNVPHYGTEMLQCEQDKYTMDPK